MLPPSQEWRRRLPPPLRLPTMLAAIRPRRDDTDRRNGFEIALSLSALRSRAARPAALRLPHFSVAARLRLPGGIRWGARADRWLRRATPIALGVCLLLGVSGGTPLPRVATRLDTATPGQTAAASVVTAPASPSAGVVAAASAAFPTETPLVVPSQTAPTAAITFNNMMLDSPADPNGVARTFSFITDGGGLVEAQIVATSPLDATRLCLTGDASPAACVSGATPDFIQPTTTAHSHWTVTLISAGDSLPTVDVAFSWPTSHPYMTLTYGRLQGFPNPDPLRSLTATFKATSSGRLSVGAAWPPATADPTLTLADVTGAQPIAIDTVDYSGRSGISPAYSRAVSGGRSYRVELYNNGPDLSRIELDATIEFP